MWLDSKIVDGLLDEDIWDGIVALISGIGSPCAKVPLIWHGDSGIDDGTVGVTGDEGTIGFDANSIPGFALDFMGQTRCMRSIDSSPLVYDESTDPMDQHPYLEIHDKHDK